MKFDPKKYYSFGEDTVISGTVRVDGNIEDMCLTDKKLLVSSGSSLIVIPFNHIARLILEDFKIIIFCTNYSITFDISGNIVWCNQIASEIAKRIG